MKRTRILALAMAAVLICASCMPAFAQQIVPNALKMSQNLIVYGDSVQLRSSVQGISRVSVQKEDNRKINGRCDPWGTRTNAYFPEDFRFRGDTDEIEGKFQIIVEFTDENRAEEIYTVDFRDPAEFEKNEDLYVAYHQIALPDAYTEYLNGDPITLNGAIWISLCEGDDHIPVYAPYKQFSLDGEPLLEDAGANIGMLKVPAAKAEGGRLMCINNQQPGFVSLGDVVDAAAETSEPLTLPEEDPAPASEETPPTEVPVTEAPATEVPVTEAPATEVPVTEAPATEVPVTEAPATEVPVTEAPATEVPVTEAPATKVPVTEAPPTEVPVTEAPATEVPVTVAPPTEVPVTEVPVTEVPVTEPPVTAAPVTNAPDVPAYVEPEEAVTKAPSEHNTPAPAVTPAPTPVTGPSDEPVSQPSPDSVSPTPPPTPVPTPTPAPPKHLTPWFNDSVGLISLASLTLVSLVATLVVVMQLRKVNAMLRKTRKASAPAPVVQDDGEDTLLERPKGGNK